MYHKNVYTYYVLIKYIIKRLIYLFPGENSLGTPTMVPSMMVESQRMS
jgi:hypothetical protein